MSDKTAAPVNKSDIQAEIAKLRALRDMVNADRERLAEQARELSRSILALEESARIAGVMEKAIAKGSVVMTSEPVRVAVRPRGGEKPKQ